MISRRAFLSALAALPCVGKLIPQEKPREWHVEIARHALTEGNYITVPWHRKLFFSIDPALIAKARSQDASVFSHDLRWRLRRTTDDAWRYSPNPTEPTMEERPGGVYACAFGHSTLGHPECHCKHHAIHQSYIKGSIAQTISFSDWL